MDCLIFRFLTIFFLFKISLFGEIYVLSYKIVIKNNIVFTESLYVSDLMIPSKKFKYSQRIMLESKDKDNNFSILKQNRENILKVLFANGVILEDYTTALNLQGETQTTMILPPIYISIDRLNKQTYLTILKEH